MLDYSDKELMRRIGLERMERWCRESPDLYSNSYSPHDQLEMNLDKVEGEVKRLRQFEYSEEEIEYQLLSELCPPPGYTKLEVTPKALAWLKQRKWEGEPGEKYSPAELFEGLREEMSPQALVDVEKEVEVISANASDRTLFELPGRSELETFFREHIIDIVENEERYKTFGIDFPAPVVLHGPPGCGKTFAVQILVEYLDWPMFNISSDTVGATYIHQTSMKIGEIFRQAIEEAPAVVVIDEMDAIFTSRNNSHGRWEVEEVSALLLHVQAARKNRVLVIGMTNRIESLDKALLRRGRFDHVLLVDMASLDEILGVLNHLLSKLPCQPNLSLDHPARVLAGRPLSDVDFIVREAARLAAKAGKKKIDDICLAQALKAFSIPPLRSR